MRVTGAANLHVLVFMTAIVGSQSARILLHSIIGVESHMMYFSVIARQFHAEGHQVYVISSPGYHWNERLDSFGMNVLTWSKKYMEIVNVFDDWMENHQDILKKHVLHYSFIQIQCRRCA